MTGFDYILHRSNGTLVELNSQVGTFRAVTSEKLTAVRQDVSSAELTLISSEAFTVNVGDWIQAKGIRLYCMSTIDKYTCSEDNNREYQLTFYSPEYYLRLAILYNTSESESGGVYSYSRVDNTYPSVGTFEDFVKLCCYNCNSVQGERMFKVGTISEDIATDIRVITFSDYNCLAVLKQSCESFETTWKVRVNEDPEPDSVFIIDFGVAIEDFPVTLKVEHAQGLTSIDVTASDKDVFTQFVIKGGSENLPSDYPYPNLQLDEDPSSTPPILANSMIKLPDLYSRWGKSIKELTYEDIKPSRTGTVTSISGNILKFTDSDLIGAAWSPVGGTIHFVSGHLIGFTFNCKDFNSTTGEITIESTEENNGFVLPSPTDSYYRINELDKYNIAGVSLPTSYITAAKTALKERALLGIDYWSQPRMQYAITIDPKIISVEIVPNMGFHIEHSALGIDKVINVQQVVYDLSKDSPYDIESILISDLKTDDSRADATHRQVATNRNIVNGTGANNVYSAKLLSRQRILDDYAKSQGLPNWGTFMEILSSGKGLWKDEDGNWWLNVAAIKAGAIGAELIDVTQLIANEVFINGVEDTAGNLVNNYLLHLTSQVATVACDSEGTVTGTLPTSTAIVYHGASADTGWSFSGELSGCTGSVNEGTGVITITGLTADDSTVTVSATKADKPTLQATFRISKVYAGVDGIPGSNGLDGISIVWKGDSNSHLASPENGWAYYNTVDKKSYIYNGAWYVMTKDGAPGQNGEDGLSIVWKGDLSTPPSDPVLNWVYRDIDDGKVYIYNGSSWELMVVDGSDGVDGAAGQDGWSVYITYNASLTLPTTPTGDGTTGGWHTAPTSYDVWMSQKVAPSASSGTWGTPIKIKGDVGEQGPQGVPGVDGVDGSTTYTWIRYSDSSTGDNISNDPTGKTYIGFAYNKLTPSESSDPDDYIWSLIKGPQGDQGVPGVDGEDGQSLYTWIKYSDYADGTDLYDVPTDSTAYIGIAINKLTSSESSTKTDYVWSRFRGVDGIDGDDGSDAVYYYLTPSVDAVIRSMDGTATPSTVSCAQYKIQGGGTPVAANKTIKYQRSIDGTMQTYSTAVAVSTSIYIDFYLYDGVTELWRTRVPVLHDLDEWESTLNDFAKGIGYADGGGTSAYEKLVGAAGGETTIIVGGYLRTSLIDANAVIANAALIGGVTISGTKLYTGTGEYGNANTPFYIEGNETYKRFSLGNKFTFDGTDLIINGSGTFSGTISVGTSPNIITIGKDAYDTGKHGIKLNAYNYWYLDGANAKFMIGGASNYVEWDGTDIKQNGAKISSGSIIGTSIDIPNATTPLFKVTSAGVITAKSGTIGGLKIAATKTYLGDGNYGNSDTGFYVDTSAKFSLKDKLKFDGTNLTINGGGTFSGALSAATGSFAGSLSAATGTFSGSLSAASGTFEGLLDVGGIKIGLNAVNTGVDGLYIDTNNYWDENGNFKAGSTGSYIHWNGTTFAIKGDITGSTGTFGGVFAGTIEVGSTLKMGADAGGTGDFGIYIDSANYWLESGFSVGVGGSLLKINDGALEFSGELSSASGTFTGRIEVGDYLKIGANVSGANDGIFINTNNYWYDTGVFKVGSSTKYLHFDGTNATFTGTLSAASGTFSGTVEAGGIKVGLAAGGTGVDGIYIDDYNYWYDNGTFRVGDSVGNKYLSYTSGGLTITGGSITSSTFYAGSSGNSVAVSANAVSSAYAGVYITSAHGTASFGDSGSVLALQLSSSTGLTTITPDAITLNDETTGVAGVSIMDSGAIIITNGSNEVVQISSGKIYLDSMPSASGAFLSVDTAGFVHYGSGSKKIAIGSGSDPNTIYFSTT